MKNDADYSTPNMGDNKHNHNPNPVDSLEVAAKRVTKRMRVARSN